VVVFLGTKAKLGTMIYVSQGHGSGWSETKLPGRNSANPSVLSRETQFGMGPRTVESTLDVDLHLTANTVG